VANSQYEDKKSTNGGANLERGSVNDHYGFYQTPAKVIKQDLNDLTLAGQDDEKDA